MARMLRLLPLPCLSLPCLALPCCRLLSVALGEPSQCGITVDSADSQAFFSNDSQAFFSNDSQAFFSNKLT
jgi:hypothetical protein